MRQLREFLLKYKIIRSFLWLYPLTHREVECLFSLSEAQIVAQGCVPVKAGREKTGESTTATQSQIRLGICAGSFFVTYLRVVSLLFQA